MERGNHISKIASLLDSIKSSRKITNTPNSPNEHIEQNILASIRRDVTKLYEEYPIDIGWLEMRYIQRLAFSELCGEIRAKKREYYRIEKENE